MAGFQFYGGIDLGKTEVQNPLFHKSASDIASPIEGQFYYNTGTKKPRWYDGTAWQEVGAGAGTVLSFSAGALSPIFTTSVAASTSTPALSFILTNAAQNSSLMGPETGGAGAPTYRAIVQADIPATIPISYWGTATATINMGGFKVTNQADGTSSSDSATWGQVQSLFQGVRDFKESVRLASNANVSVTYSATGGASLRGQITGAPNTLNGTTLVANDRILLKDQSTGAQNGIWVVTTVGSGANGVWDRAADFDQDAEVSAGLQVAVTNYTTTDNRGIYVLTTSDPIVVGGGSGTSLAFTQISAIGGYVAGAGMSATGFTFNVNATDTSITVNADDIGVNVGGASGLQISSGLKVKSDVTTANTIGVTVTSNGVGFLFNTTSFTDSGSETLALASTVVSATGGILLSSGAFSISTDATTIELSANALRVKDAGITFAKIASGVWGSSMDTTGSVVNVKGYTFVTGATVSRTAAIAQTIATGAWSYSITHNLGTKNVTVFVRNTGDDSMGIPVVVASTTNAVTISGTNNSGASISAVVIVQG